MTKRYSTTIKKMRYGAARAALLVMVAVFASTSLFAADALVGAAYPGGGSSPIQSGVRGEAKEFNTKTKAKHSALPNSTVSGSNLNSITINIGSNSNSSDTHAPD